MNSFMPIFYKEIEESLKPLFEFVVEPNKIEFEDDIALVIKSFIKQTHAISETIWTIYPHLIKIFEKNKNAFGNLLDVLNYFLLFGRDVFMNKKEYLEMLI